MVNPHSTWVDPVVRPLRLRSSGARSRPRRPPRARRLSGFRALSEVGPCVRPCRAILAHDLRWHNGITTDRLPAMRTRDRSASFPSGESHRRRLLFFVAASFLLGAALALLASSPKEPPHGPSPAAETVPASPRESRTYRNPILFADWSDPDVIRVGDDYWLVASSFHEVPGLPILHSKDLVHWTLAGHAAPRLPSPRYDVPRHGGGVWAPSIRCDGGFFHVWYGDPDLGIFTTRARDPRGPWEPLRLVKEARGLDRPVPVPRRGRLPLARPRLGEEPRRVQRDPDRPPPLARRPLRPRRRGERSSTAGPATRRSRDRSSTGAASGSTSSLPPAA